MKANVVFGLLFLILMTASPALGKDVRATVVYDDRATVIDHARLEESSKLWIATSDLTRATRFEVKPQGVCRDELCFPLPKARQQEFLHRRAPVTWFNL